MFFVLVHPISIFRYSVTTEKTQGRKTLVKYHNEMSPVLEKF